MRTMPLRLHAMSNSIALVMIAPFLLVSAVAADRNLAPRDLALIEEAYHVWITQADKIWPGASQIRTPMIYVADTEEYALGFDRPLKGFVNAGMASDKIGRVQVRVRTFPVNSSAAFPVDGVISVVMGRPVALGLSPEAWVITACHEMFHGYQHARGSTHKIRALKIGPEEDGGWQLTFPFPYRDADVMRLIHVQGYLLWLASNAAYSDDAKYNVGTAIEGNLVYRARLDSLMPDGKAERYSVFQEWSEGVAAYTEFKIAEAAGTTNYQPTAAFSMLPDFQGYASVWKVDYRNRPYLVKHAGRATKSRTTFYHLGMGKALALDLVLPGWKTKYFMPEIWLDDLLREASESH
jgi:hypothetical protein